MSFHSVFSSGIVSPGLKEDKMRRVYPAPPDIHGKALDKYYNKKMVMWDNYYEYINLPIACIFGIIYGEIWEPDKCLQKTFCRRI